MKLRTVVFVIALLAMVCATGAQEVGAPAKSAQHHHYQFIDLGTFGGPVSYFINGFDGILNDQGISVGWADTATPDPGRADFSAESTNHHAFFWKNGVMTDLGTLGDFPCSTANGVNSAEQAVGDTGICLIGGGPPFLSEHGQPMVDLNTLVLPGSDLTLTSAAFINDRGEIAGSGMLPNGEARAVLLVPACAEETAAADVLGAPQSSSVAAHTLTNNSENSGSGARNRALNIFRQRERLP